MDTRYNELFTAQNERKIERVVYPTGGSRVVLFSGAYAALYDVGILKDVEMISGASAGSLAATNTAIGILPRDFYNESRETNLDTLLGVRIGSLFGNPPGITPITRDGKLMLPQMRKLIDSTIKKFLNEEETQKLTSKNKFLQELELRFQQPDPIFTYGDLAALHEIFPQRFKKLFIATITFPDGKPCIFNPNCTPNVEIATTCCASAAIPGVLPPVSIGEQLHVDGGTYEHIPVNYFDHPHETNLKPEKTLVFTFVDSPDHEKSSSFKALYGDPNNKQIYEPYALVKYIRDEVMPYFTGLEAEYRNTEQWNINYLQLSEYYPLNAIELDPCGLMQYEFSRATKLARQFYTTGYLDTMKYLVNHQLNMNECEAEKFYGEVIHNFEFIYQAIVSGSSLDLEDDEFWQRYKANKHTSTQNKCTFLHDYMKKDLESIQALALTYSLEFRNKLLNADELFKDVYQASFDKKVFSVSNILGEPIYLSCTLKEKLKQFSLFSPVQAEKLGERTDKILKFLKNIPSFINEYLEQMEVSKTKSIAFNY